MRGGPLPWRIQVLVVAYGFQAAAVLAQQDGMATAANQTTTTSIEPSRLHPRITTYRNAYGTHFQCTSTCYLIMWAYLACVAALLALLSVIPVQSPSKPENAPFVLWLDNNSRTESEASVLVVPENSPGKWQHRLRDRVSRWLFGFQEKEDEQATIPKTFESIGVETDDALLPPHRKYDDVVLVEDVETLFDPLPPSPREWKPGIFAPVTPRGGFKDPGDGAATAEDLLRRASLSPIRQGSIASMRAMTPRGRRSTAIGSTVSDTRENLLVAVERRASMQKRTEKRKEYAKSDIAHDNLHEHELHMYEYLEFVRSLLEGVPLKKITQKSGKVVRRTFFITPNLGTVYWNQVGTKGWVVKKSSIETSEISHVTKGADDNTGRVQVEKQELCLTIVMTNGKRLVLEAKDDTMRQRLFLGFSRLATEKREEKRRREAGEPDEPDDSEKAIALGLAIEDKQGSNTQQHGLHLTGDLEKEEQRAKAEEDDPTHWRVKAKDIPRADGVITDQDHRPDDAIPLRDDDER